MPDCPKCGRASDGPGKLCAACGADLPEDGGRPRTPTLVPPAGVPVPPSIQPTVKKIFCPECGAPIPPGLAFCGRCGNKVGV